MIDTSINFRSWHNMVRTYGSHNLVRLAYNGLKPVATKYTEPTALANDLWKHPACNDKSCTCARAVSSTDVVATDFNPWEGVYTQTPRAVGSAHFNPLQWLNNSYTLWIYILVVIGGIIHPDQLKAQEIDATFLSISDGVASPNVQEVTQDKYGYLWIGTTNGLQRYDGYNFETFKNIPGNENSIHNNNIWSIVEDEYNNLWIGTSNGVSKMDRSTKTFKNYNFREIFNLPIGNWNVFNIFIDSDSNIWGASRSSELVVFDKEMDTWKRASYEIPGIEGEGNTSNNASFAITEDSNGNLWFGSFSHGLMHRAKNGKRFKPVTINPSDLVDFTDVNHNITALFADQENKIWITTRNGVFKYDPVTHNLTMLHIYSENQADIWNHFNDIQEDPDGNIWILNNYRGILKFEGNSDQFQYIPVKGVYEVKGIGMNITFTHSIVDKSGIFWIGTRTQGLLKYNPDKKPFVHYTHTPANDESISMDGVFGLHSSYFRPGTLYVGTRGTGLNIFDEESQTFRQVEYRAINDAYGGAVRSIDELPDGTVFLGTWGDGIIELDENFKERRRFAYDPLSKNSISDNRVRVIERDSRNNFWVGTNNGLNYFEPGRGTFQSITSIATLTYAEELFRKINQWIGGEKEAAGIVNVTDYQDLSEPFIVKEAGNYLIASIGEGDRISMADFGYLLNEEKDTLWIQKNFFETKYAGGAEKNRINIEQVQLSPGSYELRYRSDDSHSYGLWNEPAPNKSSLYGIVLIHLTADESAFVDSLLDQQEDELIISGNSISSLQLTEEYLWVGTGGDGLNRIDLSDNTVKIYRHEADSGNTLGSNTILDLDTDSRGNLWITTDAGLDKLDVETNTFTHYDETDGLPTNLLESVLVGNNDEIWISSQNGLSNMVTNESLGKVTFINYNSDDGLGGDIFISQIAAFTPGGRFYFGGDHGLNAVNKVKANDVPPAIVLSDLLISNQSIYEMGEESPFKNGLLDANDVSLAHNQNNLSFEFAALHYANPNKNQYAHILKGYDKDWVYDNRNYAAYTNLDPGDYEFAIRASNAYGVWNEDGKSLRFTILPPWYKTWWAYAGYALLLGIIIFGFDREMRKRLIRKERERSREIELAQAKEIEKAYNELKLTQSQLIHAEKMASLGELTAGIAHEIQNPLNFVNNFSDVSRELLEEVNEELAKGNVSEAKEIMNAVSFNLQKINHHGKRADSIVKGMLQHSRSSSGIKEPTDINALCDEYLRLAYHGLRAKDKSFNATIKTDFDSSLGKVPVIPQDLGRVMLNLITNAFYAVTEKKKQARNGYEPTVLVTTVNGENQDGVLIKVSDNGNGIPPNILDKIFQPFFTTKPTGEGTGLGLSMSYDIITKGHDGKMQVLTEEGKGTEFIIEFPK